jgi:hypothetical protein
MKGISTKEVLFDQDLCGAGCRLHRHLAGVLPCNVAWLERDERRVIMSGNHW